MAGRPFSSTEIREIKQFRNQGLSYKDIAALMERSAGAVHRALEHVGRSNPRPVHMDPVNRMRVPETVWADKERRAMLEPRDMTARLLGDPLPGMSALERK